MSISKGAAAAAAALLVAVAPARAAEGPDPSLLAAVIARAREASPEVRRARLEQEAVAGRRLAAQAHVPTDPLLETNLALRHGAPGFDVNGGVTLSQELELGGQRGTRLDEAAALGAVADADLRSAENEVAAATARAWVAWRAADEATALAQELQAIADAMAAWTAARLREQLASEIEAHLAAADAARMRRAGARAAADATAARLALEVLLQGPVAGAGPLAPLTVADEDPERLVARALAKRGEPAAAEAERRAQELHKELLERGRVPNVILSLSGQRDGFAEYVAGIGASLPLRFLGVRPTLLGEIAEQDARARQAAAEGDAVRRRVRAEVLGAAAMFAGARAQLDALPRVLVASAHGDLALLRDRVTTGALPLRDALLTERTLIELLQDDLDARRDLALASVELTHAAALPWPGDAR